MHDHISSQKRVNVVVGIIKRDGKVLIAERPPGKPYSGYWEFPGGKIEANESGKEALYRELQEELGIEVTHAEHWFDHHHTYPDKTVLLEMWLVNDFSGEPYSKEGQLLQWAELTELLQLNLLEGNWPIIDKIKTLFE